METTGTASRRGGRGSIGVWSLVAGLLAIIGVAMVALSTLTASGSALEPPNWLRAVTIPLFPLGVAASVVLGVLALRRNAGRRGAIAGLVLTAVSVTAFVAMLSSVDY